MSLTGKDELKDTPNGSHYQRYMHPSAFFEKWEFPSTSLDIGAAGEGAHAAQHGLLRCMQPEAFRHK
eukprot:804219-Pelagomonas_calceolata.AAC.1